MPTLIPYDSFAEAIGDGTIDLDSDILKMALFTDTYVPNVATDTQYSGLTGEVAGGNGYTATGKTLPNVTLDRSANVATLDADSVQWDATGSGFTFRYAVLYSGVAGNNLIGYLDFGSNIVVAAGNSLTLNITSGLISLTVPQAPAAVTYNGEVVTYNGEVVTYG